VEIIVKERVQKLMAQANIGSRRANEELIKQGRVRVNGKVIKLGDQADPQTDRIEVDGVRLNLNSQSHVYILLNKPLNVLTTSVHRGDDERQTVYDLVPVEGHVFTIGRLDADSEGLLVLTNDGALTERLTHPRYGHTKTYRATVYGLPTQETIEKWETGVYLEEGRTAPCSVRIVKGGHDLTTLEVIMTEGKKRQIRRVASMLGHPVKRLQRTHIGRLAMGDLRPGEWRELNSNEVELMKVPALKVGDKRPPRIRRTRPNTPSPRVEGEEAPARRGKPSRRDKPGVAKRDRAGTANKRRDKSGGSSRPPQRKTTRRRTQ
jgi:pseudouridine synthase